MSKITLCVNFLTGLKHLKIHGRFSIKKIKCNYRTNRWDLWASFKLRKFNLALYVNMKNSWQLSASSIRGQFMCCYAIVLSGKWFWNVQTDWEIIKALNVTEYVQLKHLPIHNQFKLKNFANFLLSIYRNQWEMRFIAKSSNNLLQIKSGNDTELVPTFHKFIGGKRGF